MTGRSRGTSPNTYRTIRAATEAVGMSGTQKGVLMILATYADGETGENAYPTVPTLAARACVDESTVRRMLGALEDLGLIEQTGERRNPNGRPTKVWRLDLAALDARSHERATTREADCDHAGGTDRETGQGARQNRAESPSEPGSVPSDLSSTSQETSDAADAAPRFASLDNPRLDDADRNALQEAEEFLRDLDDADAQGDNVHRLLEALSPYYEHVARWLAACLRNEPGRTARYKKVRSLWWEHVVDRTEGHDWDEFLTYVQAADYDEDDAEELWSRMVERGIRHPGLMVRSVGGEGGVYSLMEKHLAG